MLLNSFSHIPGVGFTTERKIWESGIYSMDDFVSSQPTFLTASKQNKIINYITLSKDKLIQNDIHFFYRNFHSSQHWRLFREFRKYIVYLDIETTGLGSPDDIITTIALYDGREIRHYVNGINLDDFKNDIYEYRIIVTYNGKTFDIPFIERYLNIPITHAHIDLRYILKSLGYSGGLKSCERQLGIERAGDLADIDGFFAVLLWKEYMRHENDKSLQTLLSYNIEDVLHLETLMVQAYNKKLEEVPLSLDAIHIPTLPENPFKVHSPTIKNIQERYFLL